MVKSFEVAVINKDSLYWESVKKFKDRNYSKKTLKKYEPRPDHAKFIKRQQGFSIYKVPVKLKKVS